MEKIIIFGACANGKKALDYLCHKEKEVLCFLDNDVKKNVFFGKEVINFDKLNEITEPYHILVSSRYFADEMIKQLEDNHIYNYSVYDEECSLVPEVLIGDDWKWYDYEYLFKIYNLERYLNIGIFGINEYTPKLINEFEKHGILNRLKYFVDIDEASENTYMGIPCIKLSNLNNNIDCLIINVRRSKSPVRDIFLEKEEETVYDIVDFFSIGKYIKENHNSEIEKFHNIHKEQRCFIVATGPSLKMDDLDKLYENNEVCIGLNKIYLSFDKTKWRPNYCIQNDPKQIYFNKEEIYNIPVKNKFVVDSNCMPFWNSEYSKGAIKCHKRFEIFAPNYPGFSDDFSYGFYGGFTVTYAAIQMAYYFGFNKIYLIGVDFSYSNDPLSTGNHFCANYNNGIEIVPQYSYDETFLAYKKAEKYSRKNGFRIYNATRGGKLEVFERVNFNSLF